MDGTVSFLTFNMLVGTFIGVTLSLFLLLVKSIKSRANLFLGISVLAMTMYIIPGFIERVGWNRYFPYAINIGIFSGVIVGPSTYLYARACTEEHFRLSRKIFWHFLPLLVHLITHYEFFLLDTPVRLAIQQNLYATGQLYEDFYWLIFKVFYTVIYFAFTAQIIYNYRRHLDDVASSIDKKYHRWLWFFSSSLLVPILVFSFFVIRDARASSLNWFTFSIFIYLFSVYIAALFTPEIFHAFPHQTTAPPVLEEPEKKKYTASKLQDEKKEALVDKLIRYIQSHSPYREQELTLAGLSDQVDIPVNYLSQIINESMNCTFLDFINQYRVEEAKVRLRDKDYAHYTIEAIAYEVGFNSKSAFYAAFKKFTNTTPSAFRDS